MGSGFRATCLTLRNCNLKDLPALEPCKHPCQCRFFNCHNGTDASRSDNTEHARGPTGNALQNLVTKDRKPVLVVGSGILRQCNFGPFADWTTLLHEVAHRLRVPFNALLAREHPTLYWESMLVAVAARVNQAPHKQEPRCLEAVREVVKSASERTSCGRLGSLLRSENLKSIVSLNFTACPLSACTPKEAKGEKILSVDADGKTIWLPHGHYSHPSSIRMGARHYAKLAASLENSRREYQKRRRLNERCSEMDQFICHILESPLIFAGCGLRHPEWTLWWLLATKARNEARHETCKSLYLTADDVPAEQRAALEGLNCSVVSFPSYDALWVTLIEFGGKQGQVPFDCDAVHGRCRAVPGTQRHVP